MKDVDSEWKDMSQSRDVMEQSIASSFFTREEIFNFYSRFKAMSKFSALNNPKQPLVGVDFLTFSKGIKETNQLHADLLERLFKECDNRLHGVLDWASFLQAMILLKPKTLASRIDSCLKFILKKQTKEGVYKGT